MRRTLPNRRPAHLSGVVPPLWWHFVLLACPGLFEAGLDEPCPEDANLWSCVEWCEKVAPDSSGTLGGSYCAHLEESERRRPNDGPMCMCYDSDYERVLKQCTSTCPPPDELDGGSGESEACSAEGGTGCSAAEGPAAEAVTRYLLYDVKMGEGFNLQREIFPRMGWVVSKLNDDVLRRCHGTYGRGQCAEWALVLPPWCRVVHWWSDTKPLPWSTFFDPAALRSVNITVLQFDEYAEKVGGRRVDLVVSHTEDRLPKDQRYGQRGGFYGWAKSLDSCTDLAERSWSKVESQWVVSYAGECEGGIQASEYRCGALSSTMARDVLDMLRSAGQSFASVLIKKGDGMSPPDARDLDEIGLREAMLFSEPVRHAGDDFISIKMQGRPFIAAHVRRTDFVRVRAETTPVPEAVAEQINSVLKERKCDQVFIATDAPEDLAAILRERVAGHVHFLHDALDIAKRFDHPGQTAAVEMWIAARSTFFIGSQNSRFSTHIQLERSWLGQPKLTSQREFCKTWTDDTSKPCLAPAHRHSKRRGSQHEEYWVA